MPRDDKDEATPPWHGPYDAEAVEHIQALMEKGINFYVRSECSAAIRRAIRRGEKAR